MRNILINIILVLVIIYMALPLACSGLIYKAYVDKQIPVVRMK